MADDDRRALAKERSAQFDIFCRLLGVSTDLPLCRRYEQLYDIVPVVAASSWNSVRTGGSNLSQRKISGLIDAVTKRRPDNDPAWETLFHSLRVEVFQCPSKAVPSSNGRKESEKSPTILNPELDRIPGIANVLAAGVPVVVLQSANECIPVGYGPVGQEISICEIVNSGPAAQVSLAFARATRASDPGEFSVEHYLERGCWALSVLNQSGRTVLAILPPTTELSHNRLPSTPEFMRLLFSLGEP